MGGHVWGIHIHAFVAYMIAAGQSAGTIKLRRHYLERLAAVFPDPWAVTGDELVAFLAAHEWAPETRKSARAAVRAFYAWASRTGKIPVNPAEELPRVKIPRALPHPTPEQVLARALEDAPARDRVMIMLAAYAGLRRAEIAGLRWGDIEGDVLRVKGKGGRVRLVPVHDRLGPVLRSGPWPARYGDPASEYLFPGQSGGAISPDAVGKILSKRLGMGGHSLRHRFATRAYAGTHDLRAVQELLGHTRPETTAIYTLVPDAALRAAVSAA